MRSSQVIKGKYIMGKKLTGAARSYEVRNKVTGQSLVAKIYDVGQIPANEMEMLEERIQTIQSMRLPAIVNVVDVCKTGGQLVVIQEHVENGSIRHVAGLLTDVLLFNYSQQLVQALVTVSFNQVVCGCLTVEDVYLTKQGSLKIQLLQYRPRAQQWLSPEQALGQHGTTKTDVFQLGVLLHNLAYGQTPGGLQEPEELGDFFKEMKFQEGSFLSCLIHECCIKDPSKRRDIRQIFSQYSWLSKRVFPGVDAINNMQKPKASQDSFTLAATLTQTQPYDNKASGDDVSEQNDQAGFSGRIESQSGVDEGARNGPLQLNIRKANRALDFKALELLDQDNFVDVTNESAGLFNIAVGKAWRSFLQGDWGQVEVLTGKFQENEAHFLQLFKRYQTVSVFLLCFENYDERHLEYVRKMLDLINGMVSKDEELAMKCTVVGYQDALIRFLRRVGLGPFQSQVLGYINSQTTQYLKANTKEEQKRMEQRFDFFLANNGALLFQQIFTFDFVSLALDSPEKRDAAKWQVVYYVNQTGNLDFIREALGIFEQIQLRKGKKSVVLRTFMFNQERNIILIITQLTLLLQEMANQFERKAEAEVLILQYFGLLCSSIGVCMQQGQYQTGEMIWLAGEMLQQASFQTRGAVLRLIQDLISPKETGFILALFQALQSQIVKILQQDQDVQIQILCLSILQQLVNNSGANKKALFTQEFLEFLISQLQSQEQSPQTKAFSQSLLNEFFKQDGPRFEIRLSTTARLFSNYLQLLISSPLNQFNNLTALAVLLEQLKLDSFWDDDLDAINSAQPQVIKQQLANLQTKQFTVLGLKNCVEPTARCCQQSRKFTTAILSPQLISCFRDLSLKTNSAALQVQTLRLFKIAFLNCSPIQAPTRQALLNAIKKVSQEASEKVKDTAVALMTQIESSHQLLATM